MLQRWEAEEEVGMILDSEGSGDTERKHRGQDESETACRDFSKNEKLEIQKEIHDSPIGGHAGLNRTYHKLKKFINWLGGVADLLLILASHLHLGLPSGLLHSGFLTKTQYHTLLSPLRASFPLPSYSRFYYPKNIGREVQIVKLLIMWFSPLPSYIVFLDPKFSSTPYSQTSTSYVSPSLSATKFHTHKKQQAKLQFYKF